MENRRRKTRRRAAGAVTSGAAVHGTPNHPTGARVRAAAGEAAAPGQRPSASLFSPSEIRSSATAIASGVGIGSPGRGV